MYLVAPDDRNYQLLRLADQELAYEVDVSRLGCGVNGALYLSDCGIAGAAPYAMDESRALALWALSEHLCTPSARALGSSA